MANPLTSSQFQRLLDARLREVADSSRYEELSGMIPKLYTQLSSDKAFEEFYNVGAMPDIPTFNGALTYLSMSPGYHNKIEPKEFAGGVMVERKFTDDNQYGVLDNFASELGRSMGRVEEKYGCRSFGYAFSSSFDFTTSEEGVALCSSSHTTKSGTSTASGFDNSGTSALSKTAVAATRILMNGFRNDISERISLRPNVLLVPDNLADTAQEIIGSEKDPDSANNTMNPQYRRFEVWVYPRLDDYSTNDWFLLDTNLMKKSLYWINRLGPEFNMTVDFETFMLKHSVYRRIGAGPIDWRFIYGNSVS